MMDKNPEKESDVEYVDAKPIDGSGAPAPRRDPFAAGGQPGPQVPGGQPNVYTYYHKSQGCGPCCGPIGCGVTVAVGLLILGQPELLRGVLFALGIIVLISLLSQVLLGRR